MKKLLNILNSSLKIKILASFILLLLLTVTFNVSYSLYILLNDKKAVVYEAVLKNARDLDRKVLDEIGRFENVANAFSLIDSRLWDKYFEEQKKTAPIDYIFVIKKTYEGYFELESYKEFPSAFKIKSVVYFDDLEKFAIDILKNGSMKQNTGSFVEITKVGYLAYVTYEKNQKSYFVFLRANSNLENMINSGRDARNYLMYEDQGKVHSIPTDLSKTEFEIFKKNMNTIGVNELRIDKIRKIVGFSKSNDHNYSISTVVTQENAFKVTNALLVKTLLWAGFLIGLVTIFGLILSVSISNPIKKLTEAADNISKGNYDLSFNEGSGGEIKTLELAFLEMAKKINGLLVAKEKMINDLKNANEEINNLNKGLEEKVSQRTKELKTANSFLNTMMNSLGQGMIVFSEDLKAKKFYTDITKNFFNLDPYNMYIYDLFGLKGEETETFTSWAKIIFDNLISFESAAELGVRKIEKGNPGDETYRYYKIEYFPMYKDEKVENIVAVITDKTQEIVNLAQFEESKMQSKMNIKIMNSRTQFLSFMREVEIMLANSNKLLQTHSENNSKDLMLLFHTLNGGFGSFYMTEFQKMAREIEDELKTVDSIDWNKISFLKENLVSALEKKKIDLASDLGFDFSGEHKNFTIPLKKLNELELYLENNQTNETKILLNELLLKDRVSSYFVQFNDLIKVQSEKLGKKISPIKFSPERDALIKLDKFQAVFATFVHLIRNSIDHGIESPSDRQSKHKNEFGEIRVESAIQNNSLHISVSDDGQGIAPDKIRQKLDKLEIGHNQLSDFEVIDYIFNPFFSTRDEVSELSGRGVGLSAIRDELNKLNGSITVHSKVGEGVIFQIVIPIS